MLRGALLLSIFACQRPEVERPKKPASVRLRAFTETGPVHAIVGTNDAAYVASGRGFIRWHWASGEHRRISMADGLPSDQVRSMVYDKTAERLWIATNGGLAQFHTKSETIVELPPPPGILGIKGFDNSVLAPAQSGGLWLGLENGLFYVGPEGQWSNTGIDNRVHALHSDSEAVLWIGTENGLMWVDPERVAHTLSEEDGCDFDKVSSISEHGSGVLVLASDVGKPRVALVGVDGCVTYKVPGKKQWLGAVREGGNTYVLTSDELYSVAVSRPLDEGIPLLPGVQLPALSKGETVIGPRALRFEEVEQAVPKHVSRIAVSNGQLLMSTRFLGTMVWKPEDAGVSWLRGGELTEDATQLSVACLAVNDCFIATGTTKLWRWIGGRFTDVSEGRRVHSVLALQDGTIATIRAAPKAGRAAVVVSVFDGSQWTQVQGLRVETPGQEVRVQSARQAPDGLIWLALSYLKGRRRTVPYGVAAVDIEMGTVWYHRASSDKRLGRQGILPVPVDVTGIAFIGEDALWLASSQGASRVIGEDIKTFLETDGLRSELLRGVVATPGGMVYTASSRGMGMWDGEAWSYPAELRSSINDLAIGKRGRLWLATDRGLNAYDGARLRRLDTRRGLLENHLLDVESDNFGRIWAMSESGLVLVSP